MKELRLFALAVAAAALFFAAAPSRAAAQVSINVQIGPQPVCPYGYFDYAPYNCAPIGYYGPEWFRGGMFIGAGPWFRGPEGFHGYVNHYFDPRYGYNGYLPRRDERADWDHHRGWEQRFHGTDMRGGYGHDNGNHYGQYKDHGHGNGHDNGNHYGEGHGHGNPHGDR